MMNGVWHYHPEFEITFTIKGTGKRFVGYSITDYQEQDLVLLGKNLPHCWISNQPSDQIVINFKEDFVGSGFFLSPELNRINQLLQKASYGLVIQEPLKSSLKVKILEMAEYKGFERLQLLLGLLNDIARSSSYQVLTEGNYTLPGDLKNSRRIEQVYSYILNNYNKEISLDEIAGKLSMTKSSFCKFVKKITKKSFGTLLNEVRISQACEMLSSTDKYIAEICYLSGFNNVSNFNKRFKESIGTTPVAYRKNFSSSK